MLSHLCPEHLPHRTVHLPHPHPSLSISAFLPEGPPASAFSHFTFSVFQLMLTTDKRGTQWCFPAAMENRGSGDGVGVKVNWCDPMVHVLFRLLCGRSHLGGDERALAGPDLGTKPQFWFHKTPSAICGDNCFAACYVAPLVSGSAWLRSEHNKDQVAF